METRHFNWDNLVKWHRSMKARAGHGNIGKNDDPARAYPASPPYQHLLRNVAVTTDPPAPPDPDQLQQLAAAIEQMLGGSVAVSVADVDHAAGFLAELLASNTPAILLRQRMAEVGDVFKVMLAINYQTAVEKGPSLEADHLQYILNIVREELRRQADEYFAMGDFAAARDALTQALGIVPDDPQLLVALGNISLRVGEVDLARREFVRATQSHPAYAPGHSNLAAVLWHSGFVAEAEASARRALELNPNDEQAQTIVRLVAVPKPEAATPAPRASFQRDDSGQAGALAGQPTSRSLDAVSDSPALSIGWVANVFDFSGYAWLSRHTLPALDRCGTLIQVYPLSVNKDFAQGLNQDQQAVQFWNRLLDNRVQRGVGVYFHPPVSWSGKDIFARLCQESPSFDSHIGLTMWETDRLPSGWADSLNRMDEVWVPSSFNRELFAASGVSAERIQVIPFGIDSTVYDPSRVQPMALAQRRGFNFLSVFQWNKRKGWDILIEAYLSAFTANDDVCLYLRTYPDRIKTPPIPQRIDAFIRRLGHNPKRIPPIILLDDFIPDASLPSLFAAADAFVLPTRGEGWGIPYMEAMAMGKPVIGTRWSSHLDFMTDENSYLINVEGLVPVDADQTRENPFYTSDQRWAQPSIKHTAALLREVFDDRDHSRAVGLRAHRDIKMAWTPTRTAEWIIERIKALGRAKHTGRSATRTRSAPPLENPAVVWRAPIFDPSGYADEARHFLIGLRAHGLQPTARAIGRHSETFRKQLDPATLSQLDAMISTPAQPGSISVIHFPAYAFQRNSNASYNIGRAMFETDGLPAEWVAACNQMDEVWAPTDFNMETFRRAGVTTRLFKVPGGIDTDTFKPGLNPLPIPGARGTVFLSIFEWVYRKGWDVLLRAWAQAFSAADDVSLVIRAYPVNAIESVDNTAEIERRIDNFITNDLKYQRSELAPIIVLGEQVPEADLPRLFAAATVYVAPSRGEGWGRPHMQAMACGLPVIATRWSGNLEFMNDGNSLLLDVERLATIDDRMEFAFYRGQQWAEPSAPHLAKLLRWTREHPAEAASIGARARQDMIAKWQWSAVSRIAADRLRAIHAELNGGKELKPLARPLAVRWEGSQFVHHSLALVNRELCIRLAQDENTSLSIIPYELHQFGPEADPRFDLINERLNRPLARADVHVRHQWPPNFAPPAEGHWVIIQPWEYGGIPKKWIEAMKPQVDEVWTPSNFVRQCYIESGLPADQVHVVPNGIDASLFNPNAPRMALPTQKKFKFLFVGGTIWRKGPDVLLDAYLRAFTAQDDVCLVIKDMGGDSFYKGQNLAEQIKQIAANPDAPEILYLSDPIAPADIPDLYTACDCLVHPYRGEGFGLPIAEAMACGLPVIVTGAGACLDFCDDSNAYLIPAARQELAENRIGQWELAGKPFVFEPDRAATAQWMRHVFENPVEARSKGKRASEHIHRNFSWDTAAQRVRARLLEVRGRPIRRERQPEMKRLATVVAVTGKPSAEAWSSLQNNTDCPLDITLVSAGSPIFTPPQAANDWRVRSSEQSLARALNEALSAANEDPVALLSSDVIVTAGWLERMRLALDSDSSIAIVGPVSNRAPAPQSIKSKYDGTGRPMRQFAKQWARKHDGEVKEAAYLGGFCALFNGKAHRAVGPLREDLPFAESLWEYFARVAVAGFKLAVAVDAYVHHDALADDEGAEFDALHKAQERVKALFADGTQAASAQQWDRAMMIFETLTSEYPDLVSGHAALGSTLLAKADYGSAARAFARAVQLAPAEIGLRNQLGVALYQNGEGEAAEQAFRNALELEPDNVDSLLNLVELYRAQERYADAAENVKRAVGLAPKNPDVLIAFGRLGLELGDAEAARMALNNLEKIEPAHPAIAALREALVAA